MLYVKLVLLFLFWGGNMHPLLYLFTHLVFGRVRSLLLLAVFLWSRGVGSLRGPLLFWSTGSGHAGFALPAVGSVAVLHGPRCSGAHGASTDQGLTVSPRWLVDSYPLCPQGSPVLLFV